MANAASHAALPYPIKNARFSLLVPYLDADGDPTDPTTPDTEFSGDNATFADCAEEVTTTAGSNGIGYITLTGAETNFSMVAVAAKVASGPKNTLATLYPRVLPIVSNGTLSAGSAGGGTLGTVLAYDVAGCFIRTTGGTGGGGTGGANNQARKIATYTPSTGAFTVVPNWETAPDNTTTYDVLLPDGMTVGTLKALNPTTAGRTLDVSSGGEAGVDWANIGSPTTAVGLSGTTVKTATDVETDTQDIQSRLPAALVSGRMDSNVQAMANDVVTAAAIAADAIGSSELAASAVTEIQAGLASQASVDTIDDFLDTEIADIRSRLPAALTANGNLKVSLQEILTTALTEAAGGQLTGGFKKWFDVATPVGTVNSIPNATAGASGGIAIVGSAMALGANAVDAAAMASTADDEIATALLDLANGVESGLTVRGLLRLVGAATLGKVSGMDTGAPVFRNIGDTKDRITATADATGNRTAVTTDAT